MSERDLRVLNRTFSLGEYKEPWTKLQQYLFIEIYNVIKDLYLSVSDENIKTLSDESILLSLPVDKISPKFFKPNQKGRDLMNAAEGLSQKQMNLKTIDDDGQYGFSFISMFPEITYNPKKDKNSLLVRIPNVVYEEMFPIESYCLLDLKVVESLNSGYSVKLYQVFKSYAFKGEFELEIDELRKNLGFYHSGSYSQWKAFNAKVLKPAVEEINKQKNYDIEVDYTKERNSSIIKFTIESNFNPKLKRMQVLNFNEVIKDNKLNLIQDKYTETLLTYCAKAVEITNQSELMTWIIADLINQQTKKKEAFDFKFSMNAISKQIRSGKYSKPYSFNYLVQEEVFNEDTYSEIRELENKGLYDEIIEKFTKEQLKANRFGYILEAE